MVRFIFVLIYYYMSDIDKNYVSSDYKKIYMYITIDNVPTGVLFYTKPGSR